MDCTYQDLITIVRNWVLDNVYNIDAAKFAILGSSIKAGYSLQINPAHSWNNVGQGLASYSGCTYVPWCKITVSNPISQLSISDFDSDLTTHLSNSGFTNLSSIIQDKRSLIYFVSNLISFLSSKLVWLNSESLFFSGENESQLKRIVYVKTNAVTSTKFVTNKDIALFDDINTFMNLMINKGITNLSNYIVVYSYTSN